MLSKFLEWLKQGDKKTRLLIAAGIFGMGLVLLSEFWPSKSAIEKAAPEGGNPQASADDSNTYIEGLEIRLKGILQRIDGAGNCEVMITLKQGTRWIYASEEKSSKDTSREEGTKSTDRNTSEGKLVFFEDSSGNQNPVIESKLEPQINGVIIVCEGGKSQVVCQRVTEAVKTVLGLGTNQICVLPRS